MPLANGQRAALEARLAALEAAYGSGGEPARATGEAARYRRNPDPKGPMTVFGYDYLVDHLGKERAEALELRSYQGARGEGEDYALEALNFVDGRRTVQAIRDALTVEFGPVPTGHVASYLRALEEIGVLRQ